MLLLGTVILIRKKTINRMNVLVSEKTAAHLPVCEINPVCSVHSTLKKYMTEIFGPESPLTSPTACSPWNTVEDLQTPMMIAASLF